MSACTVELCASPIHARGLCQKHYDLTRRRRRRTLEERFWEKTARDGDCIVWTAALRADGYGGFSVDRRMKRAHRVSWSIAHGGAPVPDGMQLDHLCRNRACVNPDHLEVVTSRENTMRGISPTALNAVKTHCLRGHEFTPENTYAVPTGGRRCRQCVNERRRIGWSAA